MPADEKSLRSNDDHDELRQTQRQTPVVDSTIDIVTPENIAFNYRVAGPFRRFIAFQLDFLIRLLTIIILTILGSLLLSLVVRGDSSSDSSSGLIGFVKASMTVTWFLMSWFYGALFEYFMNGRTPGKAIMGIRVLSADGQPIGFMQAVMRNILRTVDFFPLLSIQVFDQWPAIRGLLLAAFGMPLDQGLPAIPLIPTFLVGLITMAMTRRYQRLGDLVCNTVVVMEERQWLMGMAKLEDPRTAQLAEYLPPKFKITPTMAKALSSYVERRKHFSAPRRREIAKHLGEPLLDKFGLPADTSHDLLLCAMYYRVFIADKGETDRAIEYQMQTAPVQLVEVSPVSPYPAETPGNSPLHSVNTRR